MRLKILLFSKSKRTTEATVNLIKALKRNGLVKKVKWLNYSKIQKFAGKGIGKNYVYRTINSYKPHLTLVNNADTELAWVEECLKHGVVSCFYHDYNSPVKEKTVKIGRKCDFFYLSNTVQLQEYKKEGIDAQYLVRGCSRDVHYPVDSRGRKYKSQVAFIGKPRGGIRDEILKKVQENFDIKVWGPGWDRTKFRRVGGRIGSKKYRIVCSSAEIILGVNDGRELKSFEELVSQGQFTSNRDRLTMACGGFFLTNYNEGLEKLYSTGEQFDVYRSLDDLVDKISYYLSSPQKRREIAYRGCVYVHSRQTFDHFAERVIGDAADLLPEKTALFKSSKPDHIDS